MKTIVVFIGAGSIPQQGSFEQVVDDDRLEAEQAAIEQEHAEVDFVHIHVEDVTDPPPFVPARRDFHDEWMGDYYRP